MINKSEPDIIGTTSRILIPNSLRITLIGDIILLMLLLMTQKSI